MLHAPVETERDRCRSYRGEDCQLRGTSGGIRPVLLYVQTGRDRMGEILNGQRIMGVDIDMKCGCK